MCCVGDSVGQQALSCIVDGSKNGYNSWEDNLEISIKYKTAYTLWPRHSTSRNEFNRHTSTCPERWMMEITSAALFTVANNDHQEEAG